MKLKRLLEQRRKKKWHKFRNHVLAPEKRKSNNLLVSDYIENALNKTNFNETSETISKKRNKKLRRRAMNLRTHAYPYFMIVIINIPVVYL